ncbi:MAG: AAA family ATPase [Actinobacteria bacterium]|mgnify:CR=1 FL=1|nr:AAA family ATPase [Actinomycetota bacterium]MCB8997338.1 AAA family ATPase [Actinomycetota bacterium]MCB9414126.1 AAA family ATPase [Actinomycetota bacterium]HRY10999.1 AAA family ATPase [Candidatus Nanopelagicales bacterium]
MEPSDQILSEVAGGRLRAADADVGRSRERNRQRRLLTIALMLAVPALWLWFRILTGRAVDFTALSLPAIDPFLLIVGIFFLVLIGTLLGTTIVAGRSPHVTYRPDQIGIDFDDVRGIDAVKGEVVRSLNLFLAHRSFAEQMGGTSRRGLLFEGTPGTGKTYVAKAMAAEADVPFLFVSATSFQSMYYGATARKIRSYFRALRKTARREGGAIGFMEEIDAIATARGGLNQSTASQVAACGGMQGLPAAADGPISNASMVSEGTGGVVNELLVQMQSFDEPSGWQAFVGRIVDNLNLLLPAHRQIRRPRPHPTNVMLIAATNRASALDPALLRPGRFDRILTFEPPGKKGRREIIDLMLDKRAHEPELDDDHVRDQLAALTTGYTPARLENLFDEALVEALRRGSRAMNLRDVHAARLVADVGLGQPVAYTDHEARLIATHEAGHAVVAHVVAPQRRLEVLTIIKRKDALGLLAHNDTEDVFTRSRSELLALIQIAFGGMVAEELFFGETSTGPSSDLNYATTVAAQMVGAAGMVGSLINLSAVSGGAMSDTNLVGRVIADGPSREAVERLLADQKLVARRVLEQHRHLLGDLRDALLDRHELVGTEILEILQQDVVDVRVAEHGQARRTGQH